jgi:tRNA(Ile)-lysidine synthase
MADVLQAENQFLEVQTDEAFQAGLVSVSDDRIVLDRQAFLKLSTALKRRLLRKCIERLRPDLRDVGFDAIIRGVDYAESPNSTGEIDLIARLNIAVIDKALVIKTWRTDLPDFGHPLLPDEGFRATLDFETPLSIGGGWMIEAHLWEEPPADLLKQVKTLDLDQAWLDFDRIDQPLVVRAVQEGERFQPLGMGGHSQSLQDLFINRKIPAHLRSRWPVVALGQSVAWVVGLRTSEVYKITPETQRIVVLKLVKNRP